MNQVQFMAIVVLALSVTSIVLSQTKFKNDSKLARDFSLWGGIAMAVASLALYSAVSVNNGTSS